MKGNQYGEQEEENLYSKPSGKLEDGTRVKESNGRTLVKREVTEREEVTLAEQLKAESAVKRKRERFVVSRMWLSTLISKFFTDRGTIPDNIGNNILVTNNLYITKNHLTAIIHVIEMAETTPVSWTSELLKYVKDQTSGVIVDITMKGQAYKPDLTPSAMNSKERTWHQTLDNPFMPETYVRRAARCLYTLVVARSGARMTKQRVYIQIRAKDGASLKRGIQSTSNYLMSIGAKHKRLQSNLEEHLKYMCMLSNRKPEHLKDIAPVIFSTQTFAESMPVIQGANDEKGVLMGYDRSIIRMG